MDKSKQKSMSLDKGQSAISAFEWLQSSNKIIVFYRALFFFWIQRYPYCRDRSQCSILDPLTPALAPETRTRDCTHHGPPETEGNLNKTLTATMLVLFLSVFSQPVRSITISYSGAGQQIIETVEEEPALEELARQDETGGQGFRKKLGKARKAILKALHYLGYYAGLVQSQTHPDGVDFRLLPGDPVNVSAIHLHARTNEGLRLLTKVFALTKGQIFTHQVYEDAKQQVLKAFLNAGYLKARFIATQADIVDDNRSAEIRIEIDEGLRYRFGPIVIKGGSDYPEDLYQEWITFRPGDYFSHPKLLKLYRSVQKSGFFASVSVDADPLHAEEDRIPIILKVKSYEPYSVKLAGGYATDFGPRGRLSFKRYNIFGTAHSLTSDIQADLRQRIIKGVYWIPLTNPGNRSYKIYATAQTRTLPDDIQKLINLGAGYSDSTDKNAELTADLAFYMENFSREAASRTVNQYLSLQGRKHWAFLDDTTDPSEGFSFEISARGVAEPVVSRFSALRIETNGSLFQSYLNGLFRFQSRLQLGYLFASKDPGALPNSFRFFAGGTRSVRGYGYQNLAPRNAETGKIIGGKAILTSSMEVEIRVYKNFGLLCYADFGGATDKLSAENLGFSVGTGLRWHSPIGPIGASIAFPLRNSTEDFRFVITFGNI
jgi:translocation and assembly module TamA